MLYDLVFKNGKELVCHTQNKFEDIMDMMINHDICIVKENCEPDKVSYIPRSEVSYFRLRVEDNEIEPI